MQRIRFTKKKILLIRILLIFFLILIAFLSLYPDPPDPGLDIPFSDKIVHLAAYIVLGGFFLISFRKNSLNVKLGISAVLFCTVYGLIIEILQTYTGRMRELMDLVADITGAVIGVIVFELVASRFLIISEKA